MPLPAKGHPLFRPAMPSMAGLVFSNFFVRSSPGTALSSSAGHS